MGGRSLTTAEVATALGVKPATVYAYVSRGLLRSTRGTGGRGSTFAEDDVEAFLTRGGEPRARPGVVESVVSRVSHIHDDELTYRGHPVADLAGHHDLSAVAGLLWSGSLDPPPRLVADPAGVEVARRVLAGLPSGARLTDRLRVAAAVLATTDPWRFDLSPDRVVEVGARLVRGLVDALAPALPDPTVSLAHALAPSLTASSARSMSWMPSSPGSASSPSPSVHDVPLDRTLVLLADHGLAASTLTARVAASARAHVYATVSAGLGALDGPAHGTASTVAYHFLAAVREDPDRAIADRLRAGERVPGFGHRIYAHRDPRAELLLTTLADTEVGGVVADLVARVGQFPNVDLALAALAHAHGMRADAGEAIFAVARSVGWIAHALEEYAGPGLRFRV